MLKVNNRFVQSGHPDYRISPHKLSDMIQTKVESDIFFTVIKTIVGQNWKCQIFTANSSQLQDSGENETEWKNPDDGRKIFPFKLRHKKI
jgi:hypothetical protein